LGNGVKNGVKILNVYMWSVVSQKGLSVFKSAKILKFLRFKVYAIKAGNKL